MRKLLCLLTAALTLVSLSGMQADAQSRTGSRTTSRESGTAPRSQGGSSRTSRPSGGSQVRPRSSRPAAQPARSSSNTRNRQPARPASGGQNTTQNRQPAHSSTVTRTPVQNHQPARPATGNQGNTQNRQPARTGNNVPRTTPRPGNPGRPATPVNPGHGTRPPHATAPRPTPRPTPGRVHPNRKPPIPHNRPVSFWNRGRHYFGYRITSLPPRHVRRVYWGVPYYIIDGVYYRLVSGAYYICRPPFGVVFTPTVSLAGAICSFAYYADSYYRYRTVNENANLITQQNRIIAENNATIAAQNEIIARQNELLSGQGASTAAGLASMNSQRAAESGRLADRLGLVQSYASVNEEYYYDDGVFFTRNASGEYQTIVPPAGALIEELPEDYRVVTLDGEEYYAVDDTVYRMTAVGGTPYFEVLGQMTGSLAEMYSI